MSDKTTTEGTYMVQVWNNDVVYPFRATGPTDGPWRERRHEAVEDCSALRAAFAAGQASRQQWIRVRELEVGLRYVVQEAGGFAFVGTYTGGRFEFVLDGSNYVRQVASSQRITLLPKPPQP